MGAGAASDGEPVVGESTATVVATRLQLRGWRQLPRFFRVNSAVVRQLKADPNLISYALKADFLRLRFSTLSIWADDAAIRPFVESGQHRTALAVFDEIAVRDRSAFLRWRTDQPEDVTWEEARRRLAGVRPSG